MTTELPRKKQSKPYYLYLLAFFILLIILWVGAMKVIDWSAKYELKKQRILSMVWHWPLKVVERQAVIVKEAMPPPKNETANEKVIRLVNEKFGTDAPATLVLLQGESGLKDPVTGAWTYRYWAVNQISGACGLFQALPCEKMPCTLQYQDIECQIDWGKKYIIGKYGSSTDARLTWESRLPHWY